MKPRYYFQSVAYATREGTQHSEYVGSPDPDFLLVAH